MYAKYFSIQSQGMWPLDELLAMNPVQHCSRLLEESSHPCSNVPVVNFDDLTRSETNKTAPEASFEFTGQGSQLPHAGLHSGTSCTLEAADALISTHSLPEAQLKPARAGTGAG